MSSEAISTQKRHWRTAYLARRLAGATMRGEPEVSQGGSGGNQGVSASLLEPLLETLPAGAVVAGYLPLPAEVDVLPLLADWVGRGGRVIVPTSDALLSGGRTTPSWEFLGDDSNENVRPEDAALILVPGIAFGLDGRRLGRGAGWYDRALPTFASECVRVGVCFEDEVVGPGLIPTESHDHQVDFVLTPSSLTRVGELREGLPSDGPQVRR
ncbi:5-formyltetrahydrofolate cyclo-ligase [Actinomyces minihominis]|uniref:5-formyltetrahydrofolate cyclo-ligase n=1 Tax=Actinomyces minihominis TaxID=2002838 RepID=UPI000C0802FE|nr:5-formyltetrahydrofolate cyclo-ligase [Actinomyces minihominis]